MQKKENVQYTVEREFLSKLSVEEMLIHIIEFHINIETLENEE